MEQGEVLFEGGQRRRPGNPAAEQAAGQAAGDCCDECDTFMTFFDQAVCAWATMYEPPPAGKHTCLLRAGETNTNNSNPAAMNSLYLGSAPSSCAPHLSVFPYAQHRWRTLASYFILYFKSIPDFFHLCLCFHPSWQASKAIPFITRARVMYAAMLVGSRLAAPNPAQQGSAWFLDPPSPIKPIELPQGMSYCPYVLISPILVKERRLMFPAEGRGGGVGAASGVVQVSGSGGNCTRSLSSAASSRWFPPYKSHTALDIASSAKTA